MLEQSGHMERDHKIAVEEQQESTGMHQFEQFLALEKMSTEVLNKIHHTYIEKICIQPPDTEDQVLQVHQYINEYGTSHNECDLCSK
jgi:hypothetical protein